MGIGRSTFYDIPDVGNAATRAAKLAMTTIPIVFTVADDPVRLRYVASFSRPGGSMTGLCLISGELGAKRLELARNFAPTGSAIAIVTNPNDPAEVARGEQVAAHAAGQSILELKATTIAEIEHAFEGLVQQQAGVLLVTADAFFTGQRNLIIALAARYRVPAIYELGSRTRRD